MEYKKLSMGGYNLHLIKTDKFKMCHIEVVFRNNVVIKDITKRKFLTRILTENTMEYPTRRKLLLKLEDLYDAGIFSSTTKVGGCIITNIGADFLNPIYTDKNNTKEVIKLLFDVIFRPNVRNNEFDIKTFNLIKSRIKDSINSVIENPARLAVINALSKLGDTVSAYSNIGNLQDLEEITPENLYKYYEEMINNDYVDIFVVGDLDMDEVKEDICSYAKFNVIKTHNVQMQVQSPKIREKKYVDSTKAVQSNIVMILNLNDLTDYERKYVAGLYNYILGGSSIKSKLYKKLRLDNSLCYGVNSYYYKYNSLILINTGVDVNAKDKTISLIKETIKEMKNNITEDELNKAKELTTSTLNYVNDDIERIIDNCYYEYLKEIDPLEERLKKYKEVSLEDLYALSKKVSISITYTLQGGFNEQD